MRYFLHIGFDGSKFHGWQWQPNGLSVQETIEQVLKRIFKYNITAFGCGRTDAGVHASQYVFHINLKEPLNFDLKFRLNKNLPHEIAVYEIIAVEDSNHARYDAITRTYHYFIHLQKDPVLINYSSFYELANLDYEAMTKAVAILPLHKDFRIFCRQPHLYKHTLCHVTHAKLFLDSKANRLCFTITANRFLKGMVRILVHYLLKIGTGKLSFKRFDCMLTHQLEDPVKRLALPNGLYLSQVEYPYLKLNSMSNFHRFLKVGFEEGNVLADLNS